MYLIDTSVWIDFLRATPGDAAKLLEELLDDGSAYLCEVTFAEICFGAKDKRQLKQYEGRFSEMPFLALPEDWHTKAGVMGFELRKSGFMPYLADLMIGLVAIEHKVPLLTTDKDFEPFAKLFGLKFA
jgi:predicted nucleic acid-binding protein